MTAVFARSPPIGTMVTFRGGVGQGRTGMVWGKGGGMLDILAADGEIIKNIMPDSITWKPAMPGKGTKVMVSHIEGLEGTHGTVLGYANVATLHKTDTSLGIHYGLKAVVIGTEEHGQFPILADNLAWKRLHEENEETPLPPPGRRMGDLPESSLPNLKKPTAPVFKAPEKTEQRTAFYQLNLKDNESGRIVRDEPTPASHIKYHVSHGDILSLVLPGYGKSVPKGWVRLSKGGYLRELDTELVALAMSCPECGMGLPTENSANAHFESSHPGMDLRISIAGTVKPLSAPVRDPTEGLPSFQHRAYFPTGLSKSPIPTASVTKQGTAPSWFLLAKPRRSSV
eukprot:TRINITY_DN645_c0_g1_i10.p1 TRINITY_DN645_c0_g1~~TRINITY_DN645_c0_g1_i10.p1  ORF type:complete len:348 (+),score=53.30 TRINITY_DN645_c0_g1_i10:23-1045(+)